jgi:hypothetical protein
MTDEDIAPDQRIVAEVLVAWLIKQVWARDARLLGLSSFKYASHFPTPMHTKPEIRI